MKKALKRKIVDALNYPLFDHPVWGKDKLTLQSYPCGMESFKDLIKLCEENNLEFSVRSGSLWSKKCFTVTILPTNKEED